MNQIPTFEIRTTVLIERFYRVEADSVLLAEQEYQEKLPNPVREKVDHGYEGDFEITQVE